MTHMRLRHLLAIAWLAAATVSCGDAARSSQAPVFLTITKLEGRRGAPTPGEFGNPLVSDVVTNVTSDPCSTARPCPTVFSDLGQAEFEVALKDIGNTVVATQPTSNNAVTIRRFRVTYRRADGRGTPGVDVPYPWDGALTLTVPGGGKATAGFELVRLVSKYESPLVQLKDNGSVITAIAEVTFYGEDRVGNDVSATGSIQIDFGNFGDFR